MHKTNIQITNKKYTYVTQAKGVFVPTTKIFKLQWDQAQLKKRVQFVLSLIRDIPTEVSIRFCDTEEMHLTNASFRGKNKLTDVLSFLYLEQQTPSVQSPLTKKCYLGDILICVGVAACQKRQTKKSLSQVLEMLLIHGLVHLLGLDHERGSAAAKVMSQLEKSLQYELNKKMQKPNWCREINDE